MTQQKAPSELIEKLCKEHNLEVFPTVFDDRGISAFKKVKVRNGYEELKELLASGDVHPDSVLVVLNQDRLSRDVPIEALEDLIGMLKKCRIYIMHSDRLLDANDANITTNLMIAVAEAARAHSESLAKSKRTKGAVLAKIADHHNGKRGANGKPLSIGMGKLPWWYSIDPMTKEIDLIPSAVAAAKEAVELFVKGESVYGVKRYLDENHQLPEKLSKKAKNGWSVDVVRRLHKSANLIGEFTIKVDGIEHQVMDYLEPIIDRKTYLKFLKERTKKSTPRRAKNGAVAVFGGLGHCRSCGGSMTSLTDRGTPSLRCTNSLNRREPCSSPVSLSGAGFKGYMVESVLRNLGTKKTIKEADSSKVPLLQEKLSDAQTKLVELEQLLMEETSPTVLKLVTNQEKLIDELQQQIINIEIQEITDVWTPMDVMPNDDLELKAAFIKLIKDMRVYKISRGTNLVSIYTKNDVNVSVLFKQGKAVKEGYLTGTSDGDLALKDDAAFKEYVVSGKLDDWLKAEPKIEQLSGHILSFDELPNVEYALDEDFPLPPKDEVDSDQ
ncbi:recombinase family protein [Vibrio harveyi]|nr:recombinase family protein [Vibrio harveyi]